MLLVAIILVAAVVPPLEMGGPTDAESQYIAPPDSAEPAQRDTLSIPPDSAQLPHATKPPLGRPEDTSTSVALAWPDTVYLKSGQVLVGRILQIPGGKVTIQLPSGTPGARSYTVTFARREVLRIGRRPSIRDLHTAGVARPYWRPQFGAYFDGQRIASYPQVCTEIGFVYYHLDLDELERGIQHLYDTNATLRSHGLRVGAFKRGGTGFPVGIVIRFSSCVAAGLTGLWKESGSVRDAAVGEVRGRPGRGGWPWLSVGMLWQRIKVSDYQRVKVQSEPAEWWFDGLRWEATVRALSLGLRFDTASHGGTGLTFAFYWTLSPHIQSSIRSNWSEWRPRAGEFPESIRMNTLVFTTGLQFN